MEVEEGQRGEIYGDGGRTVGGEHTTQYTDDLL